MGFTSRNYFYNKNLKEFARELRNNSTKAEVMLWKEVFRGGKMHNYSFLRQRPVLNYIADFMCKELLLVTEVDGYSRGSEEKWKLDIKKQHDLEKRGFAVLRFTDEEVLNDIENVERTIEGWVIAHS